MTKVLSLQQAVKVSVGWVLAIVAILMTGWASDAILHDAPSRGMRWAAVALGAFRFVPMTVLVLWGVSVLDEFQRRLAFVGAVIAFVASQFVFTVLAMMVDARLMSPELMPPYFVVAVVLWFAGIGVAALYYRLRP